jgi:hypothetical protein
MRVGAALLISVLVISCDSSSSNSGPPLGGVGGGSFDPCSANPVAGFDPVKAGLPKCSMDCAMHCVPADSVPQAVATNLDMCDSNGTPGLCLPDVGIEQGASFMPQSCTSSVGKAPGVCLTKCIPRVANDPQAALLGQDGCRDDELCVPCINPISHMSTGACSLLGPHCGDGGVSSSDDAGAAMCPYTGPPLIDPKTLSPCAPACAGAHCVDATLVSAAQQALLAMCMANGKPGFCAPDDLIEAGGNIIPKSCKSVAGAEGRCLSTCLEPVAAQAKVLPKDVCADGTLCAPCFNPTASDPTAPTGACSIGCDKPKDPPLVLMCPWDGKTQVVDPKTFAACGCGHCLPTALVPAAQQSLLSMCAGGGYCAPDTFIESGGKFVPKTCSSVAGAEGRCLPSCLPPIAAQAAQLPKDVCAAGEKCAPCYNPVASDPSKPTGACNIACDKPAEPPVMLTCPWTGPPVVDPATFPACSPSCAGAHCVPAAMVPAAQQSLLAACTGGFCAPDSVIAGAGKSVPKSCSPFANTPAEGRCLSTCIPMVAQKASELVQDSCAADELCVPCYDPFSAAATGACTIACDQPTQPPYTFPSCCVDATCVPSSQVPASEAAKLNQDVCPGGFLCAPNEYLPGNTPYTCSAGLLGGQAGACVSRCVNLGLGGIFGQKDCPDNHACVPCSLAPAGTPGC